MLIRYNIYCYLFIYLFIVASFFSRAYAQQHNKIQYDKTFRFSEGIYMTFDEFKNNEPSIKEYKVVRGSQFSDQISLEYDCYDSTKNRMTKCLVKDCWGYSQNNSVYIARGYGGYFFRLHIIGALIHYFAIETYLEPVYDYYSGYYPTHRTQRRTQSKEFVILFETGERFEFNYQNFSRFLGKNDPELYEELQNTKRKRKMIYHFLIKYNEKKPIYFPE